MAGIGFRRPTQAWACRGWRPLGSSAERGVGVDPVMEIARVPMGATAGRRRLACAAGVACRAGPRPCGAEEQAVMAG